MSQALYRRYRPETFADVIGQEHVTEPLQQALRNDRINHAYLFSGPRGCGKTTSARILARCLNCEQGPTPTPCGVCQSCLDLARGGAGSLDVIEIDAASHGGVDDARDLRERAFFAPASSRYKIYIIDEAHMVSTRGLQRAAQARRGAARAREVRLRDHRAREGHRDDPVAHPPLPVPAGPAAASCRPTSPTLCEREKVHGRARACCRSSYAPGAGSVRDSLSVLDQLIAGAGDAEVTYAAARSSLLGYTDASLLDDIVDAFAAGDGAAVFRIVDRVVEAGHDPRRFAEDLLERLRDLIIIDAVPDAAASILGEHPADELERMRQQAAHFGAAELSRAADLVNAGLTEMRGATAPAAAARADLRPGAAARRRRRRARAASRGSTASSAGCISGTSDAGSAPAAPGPPAAGTPGDAAGRAARHDARRRPRRAADAARRAGRGPPSRRAAPRRAGRSRRRRPRAARRRARRRRRCPPPRRPRRRRPAATSTSTPSGGCGPTCSRRQGACSRFTWTCSARTRRSPRSTTAGSRSPWSTRALRDSFAGGGSDEIVREALIQVLGVDWKVEAIVDPSAVAGPGPAGPAGRAPSRARRPTPGAGGRRHPAPPARRPPQEPARRGRARDRRASTTPTLAPTTRTPTTARSATRTCSHASSAREVIGEYDNSLTPVGSAHGR